MLATLTDQPFSRLGWIYEEKYDGYRLLAYKEGSNVTLLSRNGIDKTAAFPLIAASIVKLPARTLLLDGEAVSFDSRKVSRFQLVQQGSDAVSYAAFDCLYAVGRDFRREAQSGRRALLEEQLRVTKHIFPSRLLSSDGLEAYRKAQKRGLEGVIAKDQASPYVEGRSKYWLKWKVRREEEFVIGGFTAPGGSRTKFGALLLGAYSGNDLHYVGKVGTGFTYDSLTSLSRAFAPLVRQSSAFVDPPRERDITFLNPKLVAQISFQEWTEDRKLRQPVFLGLRDDKKPRECILPASTPAAIRPGKPH